MKDRLRDMVKWEISTYIYKGKPKGVRSIQTKLEERTAMKSSVTIRHVFQDLGIIT